ncbi:UPF0193 protein EVG1 [Chanos chanos]|uniref:UPF0193 protein EVG1 n=1 Tax=Chanos chanos TaxID=29144 RepID=A0A6J2W389_CHACN|nr:UPF0193 protein EVG1 [Chanos chanos]
MDWEIRDDFTDVLQSFRRLDLKEDEDMEMERINCGPATAHDINSRGIWNCPRATKYSKETQDMLKLMMRESRLTNLQQRKINDQLEKGGALPLNCNPNSSAPPQPKPKIQKSVLPGKPLRRSAEKCRAGDNYTREKFRPSATRDLEKEKMRLQNLLATGQENPNPPQSEMVPKKMAVNVEERDRFQEVLDEIEERKEFLEEMFALGQGHKYHNLINTEISQKIRELEMIDKPRNAEMNCLWMKEKGKQWEAEDE